MRTPDAKLACFISIRPLFIWREANRFSVKRTRCGHRMRSDNYLNTGAVVVECHWCGATWMHEGGDGL